MKSLEDVHFLCHQNVDHIKVRFAMLFKVYHMRYDSRLTGACFYYVSNRPSTKNRINEEIQELVQFLVEENVAMVVKLEEEVQVKLQMLENKIKNIRQKTQTISSNITVIKKDLQLEDIKFLKVGILSFFIYLFISVHFLFIAFCITKINSVI